MFHGCDISVVMFWEGCITILLAYDKDIVSLLTPPHTGSTPENTQPHPTPNPHPQAPPLTAPLRWLYHHMLSV